MTISETPLLDEAALRVLALAYRARPGTVSELSALIEEGDRARLPESLQALSLAGFLRRRGERLELQSPHAAFSAISRTRMDHLVGETTRTLALMQALPTLIRHWHLGDAREGADHPLAARIVHGSEQRLRAWSSYFAEAVAPRPSWVLPDPGAVRELLESESHRAALGAMGPRTRIIVRPGHLADPGYRDLGDLATGAGVTIRVLEEPPGWFYSDGELAAMPVDWGETRPASILFVTNPPTVDALGSLFEALWARAAPPPGRETGWEPVLRLLEQALTDKAVAQVLDLDVRTVRRRIADAMRDLGVRTRFGLGIAWERRRTRD